MGDTASAEAGRGHRLLSEMWQVLRGRPTVASDEVVEVPLSGRSR